MLELSLCVISASNPLSEPSLLGGINMAGWGLSLADPTHSSDGGGAETLMLLRNLKAIVISLFAASLLPKHWLTWRYSTYNLIGLFVNFPAVQQRTISEYLVPIAFVHLPSEPVSISLNVTS